MWKVVAGRHADRARGWRRQGRAGPRRLEAVANGDGPALGRELEIAQLLQFIKGERLRNMVWLTADVHYTAAHHYDPARAQFQRVRSVLGVRERAAARRQLRPQRARQHLRSEGRVREGARRRPGEPAAERRTAVLRRRADRRRVTRDDRAPARPDGRVVVEHNAGAASLEGDDLARRSAQSPLARASSNVETYHHAMQGRRVAARVELAQQRQVVRQRRRLAAWCLGAVVPAAQHRGVVGKRRCLRSDGTRRGSSVRLAGRANESTRSTARPGTWLRWRRDTAWPARCSRTGSITAPGNAVPSSIAARWSCSSSAWSPVAASTKWPMSCNQRSHHQRVVDLRPLGQLRALQRVLQRADRFAPKAVVGPSARA